MHQVMDGFRLQLDTQRTCQQAIESEQSEVMAAQAESITALSHISLHVEDKIAAGQQAVALLHAQFEHRPPNKRRRAAESRVDRSRAPSPCWVLPVLQLRPSPRAPLPKTSPLPQPAPLSW
jgi:hypothetical protein